MKAGTIAAAVAIAMAAPATATAKPAFSEFHEENRNKAMVCLQEAIATKTGLPPEDFAMAAAFIVAKMAAEQSLLFDGLGMAGVFEPETCPGDYGRKMADEWTKADWIGLELIVRGVIELQKDSDAAATGTAQLP